MRTGTCSWITAPSASASVARTPLYPRDRRQAGLLVLLVLGPALPRAAVAKVKPPLCPPGRFVQGGPIITGGPLTRPEAVVLTPDHQLSIASGCAPTKAHLKAAITS